MITKILWRLIRKPLLEVIRTHEDDEKKWMKEKFAPLVEQKLEAILQEREDNIKTILAKFETEIQEWLIKTQTTSRRSDWECLHCSATFQTYAHWVNHICKPTQEQRANTAAEEALKTFDGM